MYPDVKLGTNITVLPQPDYQLNLNIYTESNDEKVTTKGMTSSGDHLYNGIDVKLHAQNDIEAVSLAMSSLREICQKYRHELEIAKESLHDVNAWSQRPWLLTPNAWLNTDTLTWHDDATIRAKLVVKFEYHGDTILFISESDIGDFNLCKIIDANIALLEKAEHGAMIDRFTDEDDMNPTEQEYLELLESCLVN